MVKGDTTQNTCQTTEINKRENQDENALKAKIAFIER